MSIMMSHHYPDLGSAFDWLKKICVIHSEAIPRSAGLSLRATGQAGISLGYYEHDPWLFS